MKRLTTIIAAGLLLAASKSGAQVVINAGFENWQVVSNVNVPVGWNTSDGAALNCNPLSSAKTGDKASGLYALKLQTSYCQAAMSVHEGFALTRFPVSSKPNFFTLKYKSVHAATDTPIIRVAMTKYAAGIGTVVLSENRYAIHQTTTTYKSLTLPVVYDLPGVPDTAIIEIFSDNGSDLTNGNFIIVDDLAFSITNTVEETNGAGALKLYPNPASGLLNIEAELLPGSVATVDILDVYGRTIRSAQHTVRSGAAKLSTDVSTLAPGHYFVRLNSGGQYSQSYHFTKH